MLHPQKDYLLAAVCEADDQPRYNTAAVVRLAGVPAATFRAWERRYGFPLPRRQPAGQRLYSDRDIAAIRWLHEQTGRGLAISRAVALLREGLETQSERVSEPRGRPTTNLIQELRATLLAADQQRASQILAEAFALYSVETVGVEVIQPLLIDVGEQWHQGKLSVVDEHFITNFFLRRLFSLVHAYDTGRGRGLIISACGPGEWHEVGILMVSLFLVRRGYRVLYLGPNLPLGDLATRLPDIQPDLVCLSATTAATGETLVREACDLVRTGNDHLPKLGFGGQAFIQDPALRSTAPGEYLGDDATAAVDSVDRLLASSRRA